MRAPGALHIPADAQRFVEYTASSLPTFDSRGTSQCCALQFGTRPSDSKLSLSQPPRSDLAHKAAPFPQTFVYGQLESPEILMIPEALVDSRCLQGLGFLSLQLAAATMQLAPARLIRCFLPEACWSHFNVYKYPAMSIAS
jgi:hypothetical protein